EDVGARITSNRGVGEVGPGGVRTWSLHRKIRSGLEHKPPGHFPSADHLIDDPVAAMAGDLIQEVRNRTMVAREGHAAVIVVGIVVITGLEATLTREGRGGPTAGVGKVLGVVITKEELQALGHALVYGDGKRVIVAARAIFHVSQRIPERIRSARFRLVIS